MRPRPVLPHGLGWLLVGLLAWLCALPVRAAPVDAHAAGATPLVLASTCVLRLPRRFRWRRKTAW